MQVSSFSQGKTRKAGSLTEKSGRDLKFSYGLSKVEMERQESVYDEIFRTKQTNDSRTIVHSSIVSNSAFDENSEDELDEYNKNKRNDQNRQKSHNNEPRNGVKSVRSSTKSARRARSPIEEEDDDEEYERDRGNRRNRNDDREYDDYDGRKSARNRNGNRNDDREYDDYDNQKSARNRGGNRNRRDELDDNEDYDNHRNRNRNENKNRNNKQYEDERDDDMIEEIDSVETESKSNRSISAKFRKPQKDKLPETEIHIKDKSKTDDKLSGKNNPFIVSSLKSKTDKSIEFIVGGDDDENVDPEKRKDIEIHPGFGEEIRNMADDEEIEDLENDFNLQYFEAINKDLVEFVQTLSPPDVKIRCNLEVIKGMFNEYILYLEKSDGKKIPLMMTKRKKASTKIVYTINVFEPNTKSIKHIDKLIKFGKVNSSLSRRHYVLIGNIGSEDDNISIGDLAEDNSDQEKTRKYFNLEYKNKVIGRSKPKDLTIDLNINHNHKLKDAEGNLVDNTYTDKIKNKNLTTKSPEYDSKAKIYRLDFKGRAKLPSTNNLQIVDPNNSKSVVLQLGKMETKNFSLDFSYPFCAFTAFGLAVSCLSRN